MAEADSAGVVGASGFSGEISQALDDEAKASQTSGASQTQSANAPSQLSGQGAQFIYAAATVANILCENLNQTQINLLANFLSVVTTCVYAILAVENPTENIQA